MLLTALRYAINKDSENPADWNDGTIEENTKDMSTYYRCIILAGPSEKGQELQAKVNAGEELTWDDLNSATWSVLSPTSASGYIYPCLWLQDHYGKGISDLEHVVQSDSHTTSVARLAAGQARLQAASLRLGKTAVLAPDDGVISARSATVGSLTQPGQELFRLIRGGRLEWRAEVPSADLARVQPGMPATLTSPAGQAVSGKVRAVAPSVDPQTRNGLVYVDLPPTSAVRAGMFARGEFELGRSPAVTLPQTAVVLREGFAYLFRLEGEDRVVQTKVALGRRNGERVEVLSGLPAGARVVESGAGFLADGDAVKVAAQ